MKALRRLERLARRVRRRQGPIILMYHRVARPACDPWQLAVSPDRFARQIDVLTRLRRLVPLRWLVGQLREGRRPRRVAAVTFDDGYRDVLTEAQPILERYSCPATVFLVAGAIGSERAFWWDELSRILLEPRALPGEIEIAIAGRVHRWRADRWSASDARGAASRARLHRAIWESLRPLQDDEREPVLEQLRDWAGVAEEPRSDGRPLAASEVDRLSAPGFIDIGAHTLTHPSLPLLDQARQRAEIAESRRVCQALVSAPVDAFAYPFGDCDDGAAAGVRAAGFSCACTTEPGAIPPDADIMRLPRLAVGNWHAAEFAWRLACA